MQFLTNTCAFPPSPSECPGARPAYAASRTLRPGTPSFTMVRGRASSATGPTGAPLEIPRENPASSASRARLQTRRNPLPLNSRESALLNNRPGKRTRSLKASLERYHRAGRALPVKRQAQEMWPRTRGPLLLGGGPPHRRARTGECTDRERRFGRPCREVGAA